MLAPVVNVAIGERLFPMVKVALDALGAQAETAEPGGDVADGAITPIPAVATRWPLSRSRTALHISPPRYAEGMDLGPTALGSPVVDRLAKLEGSITDAATRAGVSVHLLRDRVALHLPLLFPGAWGNEKAEAALIDRLTVDLPTKIQPPSSVPRSPRELAFAPVAEDKFAQYAKHHYLQSHRPGTTGFALTWCGELAALATVATVDQESIIALLEQTGKAGSSARILPRVWTTDWSPPNTISFLLARVAEQLRRDNVASVVTYVNPNLGYSGASYRASGWTLLGTEATLPYAYLDGRHTTTRQLVKATGTLDRSVQREHFGSRLQFSSIPLSALLIFHRELD